MTSIDGVSSKKTYFSNPERLFPDLDEKGRIPTEQFISACQGVADFVGFLGKAFTPVKNDISGNVLKLKAKFETDKEGLKYLQDLIDFDLAKHNGQLGVATEGLLWLKRGLEFMLELLKLLVCDYQTPCAAHRQRTENMTENLRLSYEKTLKRHHNFISCQLFKVVIRAAPYRRDLLKAMAYGHDEMEEICVNHIASLLGNFKTSVDTLVNYYYEKGLESRRN